MNQHLSYLAKIGFLLLDVLVLNVVYLSCDFFFKDYIIGKSSLQYTYLWMYCNAAWLLVSSGTQVYNENAIFSFEKFSKNTLRAYGYFVAVVLLYLFFNKEAGISRLFFASVLVSFGGALFINRIIHLGVYHYIKKRDYIKRRVLFIGYNTKSLKLANYLEQQPINTEIMGFYEEANNITQLTAYPIFTNKEQLIDIAKAQEVNEIFSTISPEEDKFIYTLMNQADQACIRFRILPNLDKFVRCPVHVEYIEDLPVLAPRNEPLDDVGNRIKKRFFDLVIAVLAFVFVLWWLLPLLALLVKLESRGPVFFIQQRSGKDGKIFNCIKFRSMYVNKEANERQASKNDDRITRMGRLMRRTNLDELPQFFNVLMGDMSVVGPRPHMLRHTEDYSRLINQFMIRHFVKPGITGWAQVNGFRGETKTLQDMADRVKYDIWYLENWSSWLDLRIVFMTAFNMLRGEKNAF